MAELNDMVLLEEYSRLGSEEAFAHLVKRHVNLVYSVACRHMQVPAHAEEITQAVFVILARKAGSLGHLQILEGWLHETTRLTALNFLRRERRRQFREQEAYMESSLQTQIDDDDWKSFAPLLDEGMARLNSKDRDALILRFFKDRTVREVAEAMGLKENAAQQRILRAVEKLRFFFSRRGVVVPAAAVTAAITAHSVQAAPGTLAHSVSAFAAAKGTAASASTLTLIKGALKTMAWTKSQSTIAAGVIAFSLAAPFFLQHTASAKLRAFDDSHQQQAAKVSSLRSENDRLSSAAAGASLSQEQLADLQKLRTEMAALQPAAESAAKTQAENSHLRHDAALKGPIQLRETMVAKLSFNKDLLVSFYRYAAQHNEQFPTTFEDAAPFLDDAAKTQTKVSSDEFEIVFTGSPSSITNPQDIIALREKEAYSTANTANPKGEWAKIYGFVDGHVIVHSEPENNFADFENAHIVSPAPNP
jgi:RNA polymerase sigma factor (sigma-70 family)